MIREAAIGLLLLLASNSRAAQVVTEGFPGTKIVIYITTATPRVYISTKTYSGSISNVGLFTSSNVVISSDGTDHIILYATGTIMINGAAVTTGQLSGTGTTNLVSKYTGSATLGNSQIFDNGSRVGIGNTSPGTTFVVGYGGNIDHAFFKSGGIAYMEGENDAGNAFAPTGISGSSITFAINGAAKSVINPSGNMGIGTTSPAFSLDVYGNVEAAGGVGLSSSTTNPYNSDGLWYYMTSADGASQSRGCVVAYSANGGASDSAIVFTSTTSAVPNPMGVLLETCSPGSKCRVGIFGIYNITFAAPGATVNNYTAFSGTRCDADNSAAQGTGAHGVNLNNVTGTNPGWIKLGTME